MAKRGRARQSDHRSLVQPRPAAGAGCRDNTGQPWCFGCCVVETSRRSHAALGMAAAKLSGWRDAFISAPEAVLATRSPGGKPESGPSRGVSKRTSEPSVAGRISRGEPFAAVYPPP
jgi:hypothetical protein